ncbi:MAG: DUF11 domain-containing protein [Gammaproteobacteria bacterium]|nr:DUF11 domain-containing protein [Gammaproteobacteria bacterium]
MKNLLCFLVLAGSVFAAPLASAQESGHLNVKTVVQKEEVITDAQGQVQKRLVDAAKVVPGDEVVYTVTFRNISSEPAENVVITNPLPEEMSYVEGSAFGPGAEILFSVDGSHFAYPAELIVTENGAQRPAVADDFTHIRWVMTSEINAGAQGLARFRARLN